MLAELWARVRRLEALPERYNCLAELSRALSQLGDGEGARAIWEHELALLSAIAEAEPRTRALSLLMQGLVSCCLGGEGQLLWWQVLALCEELPEPELKNQSLINLAFNLLRQPDLPATLPILQHLFTFQRAALRQARHFEGLMDSLLKCLAEAAAHQGMHQLWRAAAELTDETADSELRVVLLALLAAAQAESGRRDQALSTAEQALALAQQLLESLPPEERGGRRVLLGQRLILPLARACGSESAQLQALLDFVAPIEPRILSSLLKLFSSRLATTGLLEAQAPVWSRQVELIEALAETPAAAIWVSPGLSAVAAAWYLCGGQEQATALWRRCYAQLAGLPASGKKERLIEQIGQDLAGAGVNDPNVWRELAALAAERDNQLRLYFWQALGLARQGQIASALALFAKFVEAIVDFESEGVRCALLMLVLDQGGPLIRQLQDAEPVLRLIALCEPLHAHSAHFKSRLPLKGLFVALLYHDQGAALPRALALIQDETERAGLLKDLMDELIQTLALERRPAAFYTQLAEIAGDIQALYPRLRSLCWIAVGLVAQQRPAAREMLARALSVAAALPAGELRTQLLTEAIVCLGLCWRHLAQDSLWQALPEQIAGLASGEARDKLEFCLAAALVMSEQYAAAWSPLERIESLALRQQALQAFGEILRGAGARRRAS